MPGTAAAAVNGECKQPLRPSEVQPAPLFTAYTANRTVSLPDGGSSLRVAEAAVYWPEPINVTSRFEVLETVASADEVRRIREAIDSSGIAFDVDPDSVDGFASHEIFVHTSDGFGGSAETMKGDSDPAQRRAREPLRKRLSTIMRPIVDTRLTPYVHMRFPELCNRSDAPERRCTPCYSLVRRYRPEERRSHEMHYDAHALVTVVVSLADYGSEYTGGLYLASAGRAERRVLPLLRGDAAVHQSDLQHGVDVRGGERWSWILWYRDSTRCEEYGYEWFASCAESGNAICQALHANKVGQIPGTTSEVAAHQMLEWNQRAAESGLGFAMLKLARAHLKRLPSSLAYDAAAAATWFRKGIHAWDDPECHFGLGQMLLENQTLPEQQEHDALTAAVHAFEAAARKGHAFAAYNLGIAHLFGHGVHSSDPDLAADWFAASGLPEGLLAVALHRAAKGEASEAVQWQQHAEALGAAAPWRQTARKFTGTGGAGGVELHSAWPSSGPECRSWLVAAHASAAVGQPSKPRKAKRAKQTRAAPPAPRTAASSDLGIIEAFLW